MSLGVEFHERCKDGTIRRAIAFIVDPTAAARDFSTDPNARYPYALGSATAHIGLLLDALGHPEHGPDLYDVDWYAKHPLEYDEVES